MRSKLTSILFVVVLTATTLTALRASAVTLFDDLSNTNGGRYFANNVNWLAASFATDNSMSSSLTATLSLASASFDDPILDLFTDVGEEPGALIGTFSSQAAYPFGLLENAAFTIKNVSLMPNTNYWIVLHKQSGSFAWGWTSEVSTAWASSPDADATWMGSNMHPPQYRIDTGVAVVGDYNNNGVVDAADYTVWREGLGTNFNQNDYTVWVNHFGQAGIGAGAGVAALEPSTAALLVIGCVVALVVPHRSATF